MKWPRLPTTLAVVIVSVRRTRSGGNGRGGIMLNMPPIGKTAWSLMLILAWFGIPRSLAAREWLITLGPLEFEVSDRAVEDVLWKDVSLFGDDEYGDDDSHVRLAMYPCILTHKWKKLTDPRTGRAKLKFEEQTPATVRFTVSGQMSEMRDGAGNWKWREDVELRASGKMRVRYSCRTVAQPTKPAWLHRFVFCMNRGEILVKNGKGITEKTPGQPVEVVDDDGNRTKRGFGESPNIYRKPREIVIPFRGKSVRMTGVKGAESLELWNGGWAAQLILGLGLPTPPANVEFEIDFSELAPRGSPQSLIHCHLRRGHRGSVEGLE